MDGDLDPLPAVINNNTPEPAHSGSWDAWLDGWGTTTTDTLSQAVTLPSGCTTYNFSFWLHINTAETTTTTAYDKLTVQVLNSLRHSPFHPAHVLQPRPQHRLRPAHLLAERLRRARPSR